MSSTEPLNSQDDGISNRYQRFSQHNFETDVKFISGWKQISSKIDAEILQQEYVKAKLFFYSREYEEVNMKDYEEWLQTNSNSEADLVEAGIITEEVINGESDNLLSSFNQSGLTSDDQIENKECDNRDSFVKLESNNKDANVDLKSVDENGQNSDKTVNADTVSFAQIVEMVEKGLTIPGVEDLNIEPTNTDPKPSIINRKSKPWE